MGDGSSTTTSRAYGEVASSIQFGLTYQGSLTGAWPGDRHGWNFQTSPGEPEGAWRLAVRYFASVISGVYGVLRSAAQWSQFAKRVPLPSHDLQPGVQPSAYRCNANRWRIRPQREPAQQQPSWLPAAASWTLDSQGM